MGAKLANGGFGVTNGILRQMKAEDFEASIALSQFAFQYRLEGEALESRRSTFEPETAWGMFEGERLAAKLHLFPFHVWLNGKRHAMGGIAGVATWPEYRRQGYVRTLLKHALETMKKSGQNLSMLHPFAFGFYRKFGWETYLEYKKYELELSRIPSLSDGGGSWEPIDDPIKDWSKLNDVYAQYAIRYNGTLDRTEKWWRNSVFNNWSGKAYLYRNAEGIATGYLIYHVEKKELEIEEMAFLDETARKAIWAFVRNHDSMAEKVKVMQAPADDRLPLIFDESKFKQEVTPYFMARIVDVPAFLAEYAFTPSTEATRLVVRVEDAVADWNDGVWAVTIDREGKATAERTEGESDLRVDVGTLTAILIGYIPAGTAAELGRMAGKPERVGSLADRIPARTPFLMDFF